MLTASPRRIGAAILSHHVDEFSLVSAFFLFALGCVNILLGLIFRESAKDRRALSSWRPESSGVLPTHNATFSGAPSFLARTYDEKRPESGDFDAGYGSEKGYGFGRQGEKQAGLRGRPVPRADARMLTSELPGFILKTPEESLPRYAPKASSNGRAVSIRSGTSSSSSSSSHHHSRESSVSSHTDVDAGHHDHDAEEHISPPHSRSGTPVPTFKSSATAL